MIYGLPNGLVFSIFDLEFMVYSMVYGLPESLWFTEKFRI